MLKDYQVGMKLASCIYERHAREQRLFSLLINLYFEIFWNSQNGKGASLSSHLQYIDATTPALCNVAEQLRLVDLSEPLVERLERMARVDADVERRVILVEDVIDGLPLFVFALLGQIGELDCHKRAREYSSD